jgi:uncharacterized phage protein (TIGR01671 family)
MREIKFRAWDMKEWRKDKDWNPAKASMEYSWFIIYPESGQCEYPQWGRDIWWYIEKWITLMQYTWLKDKHWKEIYEWDIIAFPYINPMWQIDDEDDKYSYYWEVIYKEWEYLVKPIKADDGFYKEFPLWYIKRFKSYIIWNIYENPELLT